MELHEYGTRYIISPDLFKPSKENNLDKVKFERLRVHIGNGTGSTDNDYATLIGTAVISRFGRESQTYTIDLTKIFNNS